MRVVAVVPVKSKSERVKSKNFREFADGKSLFELLLDKLICSEFIDQVYVSSDELSIQDSLNTEKTHFILRDAHYCNNQTSWSDVIAHIVDSLPEPQNTIVMWCHTTSPLFDRYDEAILKYIQLVKDSQANGLVTVTRHSGFLVTEKRRPLNYSWGVWHPYSQDLEPLYLITGALFIAEKSEMLRNRYVISSNPYLFETNSFESIDIDTNFDFKLAQLMYYNRDILDG